MPEWTRNKPNFLYILQHKYCQLIFLFLNSMPNTKSTIGKLLHGPPLTINLICLRGSVIFLGLKHYFLLLSSYSQTRALTQKIYPLENIFWMEEGRVEFYIFVIIKLDIILIILPSFNEFFLPAWSIEYLVSFIFDISECFLSSLNMFGQISGSI